MSVNPIDNLDPSNLDCETFKAAAIARAKQADEQWSETSARRELESLRLAYAQLKHRLPNLTINEIDKRLELCGESYPIAATGISLDGTQIGWSLIASDGSFISGPESYGRYLMNKDLRAKLVKSRSWLSKLFNCPLWWPCIISD